MNQTRNNFKSMIRRVLKEEIEKRDIIKQRVPEQNGNGLAATEDKDKTFANSENPRDKKTKDQLLSALTKLVKGIDDSYLVVWDDHDDLKIDARDLMSFRITPDWEDHYEIVVFTRNEDRVYVTGLNWDQVLEFVKKNLDGNAVTAVDKSYDKSYRNGKDQSEHKPAISGNAVKHKKVGDSSNKDKDYNKPEVTKEEDLPSAPMKEVGEINKQSSHKVQQPVKIRKKVDNAKHIVKK
jgi:hypothetical protein